MASGTAYYNLRKDASTDNYNVSVVNQNLDEIDAQMHQNEVAATTPFQGASSNANGEKGIVPQPMAGDENKVLHGDGTWKPVQGGGGGGSSNLADLSDVDISNPTNGQVLRYNSSTGKWKNASSGGGGGSYTETTLFDGQGGAAPATITLDDDYTNYDMLIFILLRSADSRWYKYERMVLTSNLSTGDSIQLVCYLEYASYDVTNATTLTQVNANAMYIDSIVGIKF